MARLIVKKDEHGVYNVELRSALMPNGEKRDYACRGKDALVEILNLMRLDHALVKMAMRVAQSQKPVAPRRIRLA